MLRNLFNKLLINDLASTALILLALTWLIHTTQIFNRLDNLVFDLGQKLINSPLPDDILIVAIDEYSLSELGRWPWPREIHANFINRLATEKPAAIGFDVIFSEPDQNNPASDLSLATAIDHAGNVVLPMLLESTRSNGQMIETLPLPIFADRASDIGRVHAVLDEDSIVRSIYLYEGLNSPAWQLFAQAIINTAEKLPSKNHFEPVNTSTQLFSINRINQRKVNFLGPTGHFPRISYAQVIKGEFPKGLFNNKIVLVGATALGMNDLLTTPVSGFGQPMPGIEFHANVLENIRKNMLIQNAPYPISILLLSLLSLLPLIWLPKNSALIGLVVTLCFIVVITVIAGVLPKLWAIWIPPSAALVPLLLAYPIWSWRKLESAQRFFNEELDHLKQNLVSLPADNPEKNGLSYDKFDAHISQLRHASEQLRFLQKQRKETLEFISHDIRAPIAAALNEIEKHAEVDEKLYRPLFRALTLSDDFLHTSRAEMVETTSFSEIDYTSLVHQAIDDAYNAATQKNIPIQIDITDKIVWVNGSFGLLHRAILNLILNAVKYADDNTKVLITLTLNTDNTQTLLAISNYGVGIPLDQRTHLFKRFSRVKEHEAIASGSGLGLYFVKTVADKHQGTIQVISDTDKPTTFTLTLPIAGFLPLGD